MRRLLLLLWLGLSGLAFPQQEMEIIPLKHRTIEQVLPVLQPFVEPGGALSGMNNQLILRGSARNREQVKQALAAIDTPARRLMIRVSQNRDAESNQQGAELSGSVGIGNNVRIIQPASGSQGNTRIEVRRGDSSVNARVYDSRSSRDMKTSQAVQVVEGGQAFIQVGQSLPVPLRQVVRNQNGVSVTESVVYRDIGQGFYAVPRLVGERVTLEISPQFDTSGNRDYGSVSTQRVSTTVSGRLGEWIELGGSSQQAAGAERGNLNFGRGESQDNRSVWLLVEELR
ncbi:secretin N-terminal domain-containing protein [Propionivibrio sp.]|uniref:secretin N-terminal domain-containing protein n=1 Tax=Propionivibrio sp. TaxID=2212460 RepID=UPI003BF40DD9